MCGWILARPGHIHDTVYISANPALSVLILTIYVIMNRGIREEIEASVRRLAAPFARGGLQMETTTDRHHPLLAELAGIEAAFAALIALVVILAWWTDNIALASVSTQYVPMTLSVALSVLLLAVAAIIRARLGLRRESNWLPSVLGVVVLIMSSWVLIEFATGRDSSVDSLLHVGIGTVGGYELAQTSPLSIITLLAASLAAVLCFRRALPDRWGVVAVALSLYVVATGAVIALGYLYGSPLLYGGDVRPSSLLSAISYVLLGTALLCLIGPKEWPMSVFIGPSVRARLLRSFLPVIVVMVLVSGSLSNTALSKSSNPALTAALIALLTALVVGYIVTRISTYIGGQIDRTNETLLKTQEDLSQANEKLNVLGSITRHDTLNRLAVVLGRMQMLQEMTEDKEVLKQTRESLAAAQAIERIIQFTGEYQKIGAGGPVWVDVEDAFREALRGIDTETIAIKSEVTGLEVFADRMFEKVLMNLVDNSHRHGKNLKTLRLHHAKGENGLVLIYEDDGGGLSEDDKQNLFKRGHGKHTGLGMFLSKEILEFSEMSIRETGHEGAGARFEIAIPSDRYRFK